MNKLKYYFLDECKNFGVTPIIGDRWQCIFSKKSIIVPTQKTKKDIFIGFHELGHYVLHNGDKRNYDDLLDRINIELEADEYAFKKCKEYDIKHNELNSATMGLIALYLYQGNNLDSYSIECDEWFITLYKNGSEVFGQFINNLPLHPSIY